MKKNYKTVTFIANYAARVFNVLNRTRFKDISLNLTGLLVFLFGRAKLGGRRYDWRKVCDRPTNVYFTTIVVLPIIFGSDVV